MCTAAADAAHPSVATTPVAPQDHGATVLLDVVDQQKSATRFQIERSCPLGNLMSAYSKRHALQSSHVRFSIDSKTILPHDTAEALGLENEDIIDAEWDCPAAPEAHTLGNIDEQDTVRLVADIISAASAASARGRSNGFWKEH